MPNDSTASPAEEIDARSASRQWLIAFVLTPIVSLVAVMASLDLWQQDFSIPFEYAHDSFLVTVPVKTMVEEGWWYTNPRLGAPAEMNFLDYPSSPNLHIAILKVMALFDSNAFRLLNWYFLLSFPLIAVCTLAAFKTLRLAPFPSAALSIVFALAPYHYWRGIAHLWLGCYFTVPLAMIIIAWVVQNRRGFLVDIQQGKLRMKLFSPATLVALAICAALGFDFPYYPIFAAFLLLVAGPFAAYQLRSWQPVYRSAILITAIAGFFVLNLLPNVLYRLQNGKNYSPTLVTSRPWNHAEMYGLKIASLLMPAENHPISKLDRLGQKYLSGTVAASEGSAQSLGTVAACGFLALIAWLFVKQNRGQRPDDQLMDWMSMLNVACLLLATVGGFSAVVNLMSVGALRGYNRISIFIMFFSLVPVAILMARVQAKYLHAQWQQLSYGLIVCALTSLAVFEQSRYFRMTGETELAEYQSDRDFVAGITHSVGQDAQVFQFPIQNFLSHVGPAIRWDPYTHFRGYLHSDTLRWSFGAVTGRSGSQIQNWIGSKNTQEAVAMLALMGFEGIYVDRKLYDDHGAQIEADLQNLLGTQPLVSANDRLSFYAIDGYAASIKQALDPARYAALVDEAMHPLIIDWEQFDVEEVYPTTAFRWCNGHKARLAINNLSDQEKTVEIHFNVAAAHEGPAELHLTGLGLDETLPIGQTPSTFSKRITIPPGQHHVKFVSDAEPLVTPYRNVTFRICDFSCDDGSTLQTALGTLAPRR